MNKKFRRSYFQVMLVFCVFAVMSVSAKILDDSGEKVLQVYPSAKFKFDYDGDGKADICVISCKRVLDYSINHMTKERSQEKKIWYQFNISVTSKNISVTSKNGSELLKDIFSSDEEDYQMLFKRSGISTPIFPEKYVPSFFDVERHFGGNEKMNSHGKRTVEPKEIDRDWVIQKLK